MIKKYLLLIGIVFFASIGWAVSPAILGLISDEAAVVAYCDGITWPILTSPDFTLDVDNTDNDLLACVGAGTEAGDANTAHCTPGTTSDAQSSGHSGGQAICSDSGTIQYDNVAGYFDIEQGELAATIWITQVAASGSEFIKIGDGTYDSLIFIVDSSERLRADVKNSSGTTTQSSTIDISSAINTYWVDVRVQWDESRATGDEITIDARIQDGTPVWIGWANSTSGTAFAGNAGNQPGADEVDFGGIDNDHGIEVDDIEINNTLPDGWEP